MRSGPAQWKVYVSDLLPTQHPEVYAGLQGLLGKHLSVISGTRDIWCRDYMPVETPVGFVQFEYRPTYLKGWPELVTPDGGSLIGLPQYRRSGIAFDGGNLVWIGRTAIVTDRIYRDNSEWKRCDLRAALKQVLGAETLVVLRHEPGDTIAHADAMVVAVDGQLLLSDYGKARADFRHVTARALERAGLRPRAVAYKPSKEVVDGIPSAAGCYANVIDTPGMLIVPAFGLPEDKVALATFRRAVTSRPVVALPCAKLARSGGGLHCITWGSHGRGMWAHHGPSGSSNS